MTVIGYARVSTNGQTQATQKALLKKFDHQSTGGTARLIDRGLAAQLEARSARTPAGGRANAGRLARSVLAS
jgi:hypothetical protein